MQKDISKPLHELETEKFQDIGIIEVRQCVEFSNFTDQEIQSIIASIKEFTKIMFIHYTKNLKTNK